MQITAVNHDPLTKLNYDRTNVKPKAIEELDPCYQFVLKTSHAS